MADAILFTRCLGLNDLGATATTLVTNPSPRSENPGATELAACSNVTTLVDGTLQAAPDLSTALTHTAPVLALSAGDRFLYQDATDTKEWDGTTATLRFPLKTGAMVHTPIDCRVGLFKSPNSTLTMQAAAVGTNPNPSTSKTFAAMPAYLRAFVFGARLCAINAADPRFLQYSEDYHYDLWNYGDGFLGQQKAALDGGAIQPVKPSLTGSVVLMHSHGVTVYTGSGPQDFTKNFYPCLPLPGTLYSGFVSEELTAVHLFLCADGIYQVTGGGVITNLTGKQLNRLDTLNTSYKGAVVEDGKYLAVGNSITVEYDFATKTTLLRSAQSIAAATLWRGDAYFAVGSTIKKHSTSSETLPVSITLPFSDWGAARRKRVDSFFFTGTIEGPATLTATSSDGRGWTRTLPSMVDVYNYRVKASQVDLGSLVSVTITTTAGAFHLEALRATFTPLQRTQH